MGMMFCDECSVERPNLICQSCGSPTRKYWWSFPRDDKHPNVAHGYRQYYDKDGKVTREEGY